jgi:hypothetical protein
MRTEDAVAIETTPCHMKHEAHPGEVTATNMRQFKAVWEPKGWALCDADGKARKVAAK